jgi:hypothetical protein
MPKFANLFTLPDGKPCYFSKSAHRFDLVNRKRKRIPDIAEKEHVVLNTVISNLESGL